jgi:hypothetical protein
MDCHQHSVGAADDAGNQTTQLMSVCKFKFEQEFLSDTHQLIILKVCSFN